jgi:hypothetical protein
VDAGAADAPLAADAACADLGTCARDWPVLQSIEIGSPPILATMSQPGYLEWHSDPRTAGPDWPAGAPSSAITRVTDGAAFGLPDENYFKLAYAKNPPWNADDSLVMVLRAGGAPSYTRGVVLDGRTFAWVRNLDTAGSNGRWSNVNPNLYYMQHSQLPQLDVSDVTTDQRRVVKDFSGLGYSTSGGVGIFSGEGRQSNDDRYWPLQFGLADGRWDIVIYDLHADAVVGLIPLPEQAGYNYVDYWGMSQTGRFVITQTHEVWTYRAGVTVPVGLNVWSPSGEYLRSLETSGLTGHVDFGIDTDGYDVVVFIGSKYETNDKIGQTWRLDGSDGLDTRDQFKQMIGWSYHISTANTRRPGWALITSANHAVPENYDWAPMWNHTFAVKLDGSLMVAPVANLHHANTSATVNVYERESFGAPNREFTAVLWGGSWGDDDVARPIDSYVARRSP